MLNFSNLVNGSLKLEKDEDIDKYLNDFLSKKNFKEYEIDEDCSEDDIKAIKIMFNEKKDIQERIDEALTYNPFCIEAFFAYMLRSDDVFLSYRFETYYGAHDGFADLSSYQKRCYITIMKFYVSFLTDISNITHAVKVQKLIIKLCNDDNYDDVRILASLYYLLEDEKELFKLYCQNDFKEYEYILVMLTELKHGNELKAAQVLQDMFDKFKYAEYLDHVWDLDEKDPEQKRFYETVDKCFENTLSIPTFFSWVNMQKEKLGK